MRSQRWAIGLLVSGTLAASWLGLQAVHEAGHVLAGWLSGGRVANVVLHPLTLSRTDLAENPHPVLVGWAGPVFGVLAPLAMWGVAHWARWRGAFLLRFFAAFCQVGNGLYIGLGGRLPATDAGELLREGEPEWRLWAFGLVCVAFGFALWNRQGVDFGLGKEGRRIERWMVAGVWGVVVMLVGVGLVVGW